MTIEFTRKHVIISVIVFMLCIVLGVSGYFFLLQPEKTLLDRKQSDLQMIQDELTIVENRVNEIKDQTVGSSVELQNKVPVKPLLEQLLLDIDKAESLSNSKVLQIKVGSTAEEVAFPEKQTTNSNSDTESEESNDKQEDKAENDDEQSATDQEAEFLPKGMKMIKVNINGEADDYFEVEKFIDVLQALQRIIRIDGVRITGQDEITAVEDEFLPIPFEIILSAFYYPNLTELIDELPKLDTPAPSEKRNPFVSFSESDLAMIEKRKADKGRTDGNASPIEEPKETEIPPSAVNETPKPITPTIITHTVQSGETLYQISMKYFDSRAGEQIIKDANGLISDKIKVGQILKIPAHN